VQLIITPRASEQIKSVISQKGGNLALQIQVRRTPNSVKWDMSLVPLSPDSITISGVPVEADKTTREHLEGLVIDWVQTPEGPGFGVYDQTLRPQL
jgi:Fe-S cluster assembly iron-binding protein IscA